MIILGIDPGTAITGYGVITMKGNTFGWLDSGVIQTTATLPLDIRLETIYDGLVDMMRRHTPDRVAIEEAFYGKNVRTTLVLGHARGVAMLAARKSGASVTEYSPREIKKAVTGNGNAAKEQVAYMVKMLVAPPAQHDQTDAYDALAVALCDAQYGGRSSGPWNSGAGR